MGGCCSKNNVRSPAPSSDFTTSDSDHGALQEVSQTRGQSQSRGRSASRATAPAMGSSTTGGGLDADESPSRRYSRLNATPVVQPGRPSEDGVRPVEVPPAAAFASPIALTRGQSPPPLSMESRRPSPEAAVGDDDDDGDDVWIDEQQSGEFQSLEELPSTLALTQQQQQQYAPPKALLSRTAAAVEPSEASFYAPSSAFYTPFEDYTESDVGHREMEPVEDSAPFGGGADAAPTRAASSARRVSAAREASLRDGRSPDPQQLTRDVGAAAGHPSTTSATPHPAGRPPLPSTASQAYARRPSGSTMTVTTVRNNRMQHASSSMASSPFCRSASGNTSLGSECPAPSEAFYSCRSNDTGRSYTVSHGGADGGWSRSPIPNTPNNNMPAAPPIRFTSFQSVATDLRMGSRATSSFPVRQSEDFQSCRSHSTSSRFGTPMSSARGEPSPFGWYNSQSARKKSGRGSRSRSSHPAPPSTVVASARAVSPEPFAEPSMMRGANKAAPSSSAQHTPTRPTSRSQRTTVVDLSPSISSLTTTPSKQSARTEVPPGSGRGRQKPRISAPRSAKKDAPPSQHRKSSSRQSCVSDGSSINVVVPLSPEVDERSTGGRALPPPTAVSRSMHPADDDEDDGVPVTYTSRRSTTASSYDGAPPHSLSPREPTAIMFQDHGEGEWLSGSSQTEEEAPIRTQRGAPPSLNEDNYAAIRQHQERERARSASACGPASSHPTASQPRTATAEEHRSPVQMRSETGSETLTDDSD